MLLWLDYTDLESSGMKCLNDNNRKTDQKPKERNQEKWKTEGTAREDESGELQFDTKVEPVLQVLLAAHPYQMRLLQRYWRYEITILEPLCRLLGPQGQKSSLTVS